MSMSLSLGLGITNQMGGGAPFTGTPAMAALTDLSGLVIDFDASDAATITQSAGLVSQWNNKGSYGGNAVSTGSNRPTTGTRTMGTLNALKFNGANHMDISSECFPLTAGPNCIFRVWDNDSNAQALFHDLGQTALAGNVRTGLQVDVANVDNRIYQYCGSSAISDPAAPESDGPAITCMRGETTIAYNYINSQTRSGANGAPTYSALGVWRIAGDPDNTSGRWNGLIQRIVAYNRNMTIDEQQLVEGYLAWTCGQQAILFSGNEWGAKDPRVNPRVLNVVGWGDSMIQNAFLNPNEVWTVVLAGMLNRKVSNQGVGGETSTQIATRANADKKFYDRIRIIWAGTNGPTGGSTVLGDIQSMVDYQPVAGGKFILLPSMNSSTEPLGSGGYNNKKSNNDAVSAFYPNNWLDVRAMIIALQAPGGPYEDATAYAQDIITAALRTDSLHLNATGYALVAGFVRDFIVAKGW